MDYTNAEVATRKAGLYSEMKDLGNLRRIYNRKMMVFNQRRYQLRGLVLENLKNLVKMQMRALDEEYELVGLDKEYWNDEARFLNELEIKLRRRNPTRDRQRKNILNKVLDMENKEKAQIETLLNHLRDYVFLLYEELKNIDIEDIMRVNDSLIKEDKKIVEIGKLINIEKEEENLVSRSRF